MLGLLLVSLALDRYVDGLGDPLAVVVIAIGGVPLVRDTIAAVRQRRYALDYLALLAIAAASAATEFQVGAVIALMLASGHALEDYGVRRARRSLSLLADRIPSPALVQGEGQTALPRAVDDIRTGATVLVRHGEVLPLDGTLLSPRAVVDESSSTGEPYLLDKVQGDEVRSGTVNQGPPLLLVVTREARDSTYRQILALVEAAQDSGAPMVRLADRYSLVFSSVAIALAGGAWCFSGSLDRAGRTGRRHTLPAHPRRPHCVNGRREPRGAPQDHRQTHGSPGGTRACVLAHPGQNRHHHCGSARTGADRSRKDNRGAGRDRGAYPCSGGGAALTAPYRQSPGRGRSDARSCGPPGG